MRHHLAFPPPYPELAVRTPADIAGALAGGGLRRELETEVRSRPDLLRNGITRCWTRFGGYWVVHCGGNLANNTVVLAGQQQGTTIDIELPHLTAGYTVRTPLRDTAHLLTALRADYPPTTPTAALIEALTNVMDHLVLHRRAHHAGVPPAQLYRP